ncbi:glycosyltransferase family 2 protein [Psychrobacter sp. 16-MNA-CIBAN-0192]|uniref:glycosyltransferase family 2 protein n=1 Tax=Psychrobacter sp. 16-MNA-CIBAN-0192 TaxID=3140448 RepID=UPI00331685AB
MNNDIQVSVCIITYNQEDYISECLDSIINQETDFKFEIIIGEDCSTDNTRAIVKEYIEKYPKLIVPIFHERNVGPVENVKQVYKKAKGKYIAHIDGDDSALPEKLQKQFDVLESNLDCNVCSHDMKRSNKNGVFKIGNWSYAEGKYDLFDLYMKLPFFAHSSKMFKNKYDSDFWDKLLSEPYILDIDIHVANLEDGDIYHIGKPLGVYRVESGISCEGKKVNKILPLGLERVFEKGLIIYQEDKLKLAAIKELYSLAMLQCAYLYAIYDKDISLYKLYVNKSYKQGSIGIKQKVFKVGTFFPSTFFLLCSFRKKVRGL